MAEMRIQAIATKNIVIRHEGTNIEYVFRKRKTSYNFNKSELYKYVLEKLRYYENLGFVEILKPKKTTIKTTETTTETTTKTTKKTSKKGE